MGGPNQKYLELLQMFSYGTLNQFKRDPFPLNVLPFAFRASSFFVILVLSDSVWGQGYRNKPLSETQTANTHPRLCLREQ